MPNRGLPKTRPAPERFWEKVHKTEMCWVWTACTTNLGYGRFGVEGRTESAHRFAYKLLVGPIPDGLCLDHLCRNRACVNPAHLEPVTLGENVLRGVGLSARRAASAHCAKGHEWTPETTAIKVRANGATYRVCTVCRGANEQRRDRRKVKERFDRGPGWSLVQGKALRCSAINAHRRPCAYLTPWVDSKGVPWCRYHQASGSAWAEAGL